MSSDVEKDMDLFLRPSVELEKRAAEAKLPEDPNQWPNEILQELYKQVPYVSDFDPKIVMDRVDAERGFGFGHVEVRSKTEAPNSASPESMEAAGIQEVRIPIVIKEGKLQPLDLIVTANSKILPLTENRLRQAIFRPQMFDITSKTPGDQSMIGQLYPPHRSNFGYGGAGVAFGAEGLGKTGSAKTAGKVMDYVERGVGALKKGVEAAEETAGKVRGAIHSGAEAVTEGAEAVKDVAKKTRDVAGHYHGKATGEPIADAAREVARQGAKGVSEGVASGIQEGAHTVGKELEQGAKELWQKHKRKAYVAGGGAVGLGALHHGVKHGLERHRQKAFAKDLAGAIHGKKEESEKKAADLTEAARDKIKATNFAIPEERKYPVHDKDHAENALSRVDAHGTSSEKSRVYAAVAKKFPDLAARSSVPEVREKAHEKKAGLEKEALPAVGALLGGLKRAAGPAMKALNLWSNAKMVGATADNAAQAFREGMSVHSSGSLLDAILGTINEDDYAKFAAHFLDDGLREAYRDNGHATGPAIRKLASYEGWSAANVARGVLNSVKPTVMQITKVAGGYKVKTASHNLWMPKEEIIDRGKLVKMAGVKLALDVDLNKTTTMTTGANVDRDLPDEEHPEQIKDFGIWKVQTPEGEELVGYVFPTLLDLDGQPVPVALFTNGSEAALQADMAGVRVGDGASLFEGPPQGKGIFFKVLETGKAVGTIPLTVHAELSEQGGSAIMAETFDGQQVKLVIQPGMEVPTMAGDTSVIPADWSWLPLDQAKDVVLTQHVEEVGKQASARQEACSVTIRSGGPNSFSVSGMLIDKLGYDQTQFLSHDDAVFLLGGLGVSPKYAQEKLASALCWQEPIQCRIGRIIETVNDNVKVASERAAEKLASIPNLRRDLVKEAAYVPDPTSVDTILSLGFINPENIDTFIASLPVIDEAQEKMAELLLASRAGLPDVNSSALEKALRSTEEVYEGLKTLAFSRDKV